MVIVGARSDRTGERRGLVAAGMLVAAAGFVVAASSSDPYVTLIALSVSSGGLASTLGPFWALTTAHARGAIAAGTIAWVNAVGNLGGFAGPTAIGELTLTAGLTAVAGAMLLGAVLARATPTADP
jgi:ACS family tartrate transporter-like MFS transporter